MSGTIVRGALRCFVAGLCLAGVLLSPGLARASESKLVDIHVIPGQYVQMSYGKAPVQEMQVPAIIRNHGSRPVRVVATRCEAVGSESTDRLAKAASLKAHLCMTDPSVPWELHPAQSKRIGITWPMRMPLPPGRERARGRTNPANSLRVMVMEVIRASVHGRPGDVLRLVLTLADGTEARSEGFRLESSVRGVRHLHDHLRMVRP